MLHRRRSSFDSSPEESVDDAEIDKLCEELRDLVEFGAGVNADALLQARGILDRFRSMGLGENVNEKLVALVFGFELWFSIGMWNRRNDGAERAKDYLHADIVSLRAAIALARDARAKGGT